MIRRMVNLEDLQLYLTLYRPGDGCMDAEELSDHLLNHLPQLRRFTFHIRSTEPKCPGLPSLPTSEVFRRNFGGRDDRPVVATVHNDPGLSWRVCRIYSLPYEFHYFFDLNHCFGGGTIPESATCHDARQVSIWRGLVSHHLSRHALARAIDDREWSSTQKQAMFTYSTRFRSSGECGSGAGAWWLCGILSFEETIIFTPAEEPPDRRTNTPKNKGRSLQRFSTSKSRRCTRSRGLATFFSWLKWNTERKTCESIACALFFRSTRPNFPRSKHRIEDNCPRTNPSNEWEFDRLHRRTKRKGEAKDMRFVVLRSFRHHLSASFENDCPSPYTSMVFFSSSFQIDRVFDQKSKWNIRFELEIEEMKRAFEDEETEKEFGQRVALKCYEQFDRLGSREKPSTSDWTHLAAFVAFHHQSNELEILSMGTGTKCLGKEVEERRTNGCLLHDSHAEVIAKRSFYEMILAKDRSLLDCLDEEKNFYAWNESIELYFFVSYPPCGAAASIDDPIKRPKLEHKWISSAGQELLLKPGKGSPMSSLSCTNKINRWISQGLPLFSSCRNRISTCLGIEGSLLNQLIRSPIRLSGLILVTSKDLSSVFDSIPAYSIDRPFPFGPSKERVVLRPCPSPGGKPWMSIHHWWPLMDIHWDRRVAFDINRITPIHWPKSHSFVSIRN